MADSVLRCEALARRYHDAEREVAVLTDVNFDLKSGERVAVIGRSGSGKSTLLNLLGGLDQPSGGRVLVAGKDWSGLTETERCRWRNQHLGFVFQFHHLLPEFTALEAVAMPARMAGASRREARDKAENLLVQVGLKARLTHRPGQLSGGERQRVAIARALVNAPQVVLMDEPTGNLDPESAEQVLDLIESMESAGSAFVVVTHDPAIAQRMLRRLELRDGRLETVA